MTLEAWRKVLCVIGGPYKERWPSEEYRIVFLVDVFTYSQRITALTFLEPYPLLASADSSGTVRIWSTLVSNALLRFKQATTFSSA